MHIYLLSSLRLIKKTTVLETPNILFNKYYLCNVEKCFNNDSTDQTPLDIRIYFNIYETLTVM